MIRQMMSLRPVVIIFRSFSALGPNGKPSSSARFHSRLVEENPERVQSLNSPNSIPNKSHNMVIGSHPYGAGVYMHNLEQKGGGFKDRHCSPLSIVLLDI